MARRPAIERVGATEQQIDAHIPSGSIRQPGRVSVVEYSQRRLGDASKFASRNGDISNGIEIRFRVDHSSICDNEVRRLRKSGIVRQAYGSETYPPRRNRSEGMSRMTETAFLDPSSIDRWIMTASASKAPFGKSASHGIARQSDIFGLGRHFAKGPTAGVPYRSLCDQAVASLPCRTWILRDPFEHRTLVEPISCPTSEGIISICAPTAG
jgi:hypothetical protein